MIWFSCIGLHKVRDQNPVGLLWANEETTLNCNKNNNFSSWFLHENRDAGGFSFFIVLCCAALQLHLRMNC